MQYDENTHRHGPADLIVKRPSRWVVDPRDTRPPRSDAAADRAFLEANQTELVARYPDEFVAIVNGTFVDHDRQLFALGERVRSKTGYDGALFWFTGLRQPEFSRDGQQVWP